MGEGTAERVWQSMVSGVMGLACDTASLLCFSGLIECYLASNSIREAMVMANNVYKTLGANAQTLTLLATVCLEDPVTQEKAKTLLDKALAQRPDYVKAVVKKAELLSECTTFCVLLGCWVPHLRGVLQSLKLMMTEQV